MKDLPDFSFPCETVYRRVTTLLFHERLFSFSSRKCPVKAFSSN